MVNYTLIFITILFFLIPNKKEGTIIYNETISFSEEGVEFFNKIEERMIVSSRQTLLDKGWKNERINQYLKQFNELSIIDNLRGDSLQDGRKISFSADSLFMHQFNGHNIVDDFRVINFNEKKCYSRSKYDSTTIVGKPYEFSGFNNVQDYDITVDKKDKKNIHGYRCIKLVAKTKESIDNEIVDLVDLSGETIYEMYVTTKIDLPTFLFDGRYEKIENYFPLEVIVTQTGIPGMQIKFETVEIE